MGIGYVASNDKAVLYIMHDEDACSPREDDNLGKMVCWHRRYNLGDKHDYETPEEFIGLLAEELGASHDWASMQQTERLLEYVKRRVLLFPVFMYEHSMVALSINTFIGRAQHAEWDSGQVGWVYITKEQAREEYGKLTRKNLQSIENYIRAEVETYSHYLNGECYHLLWRTRDGEEDSVGGFYGTDWNYNGVADYLPKEYRPLLDQLEYSHDLCSSEDPEEWEEE